MRMLKVFILTAFLLPSLTRAEDKPPRWVLVVSHNGIEKDKKDYPLTAQRFVIPMGENNWTCSTMPDPQGDGFKMGIVCTFQKQSISLPVICHEKMAKVSTLTVGNDKFFTALALICEPHRGRTTPAKK